MSSPFYRRLIWGGLIGLTVVVLAGCATIVTDSTQPISITSSPSNAKVTIYDRDNMRMASGNTPFRTQLDKGAGFFVPGRYQIEISKQGYQTVHTTITARPSGWYLAGNIIFGGLIGWLIVDPATGSMWVLTPEQVYKNLPKKDRTVQSHPTDLNPHSLHIVFRDELPRELSSQLSNWPRFNLAQPKFTTGTGM